MSELSLPQSGESVVEEKENVEMERKDESQMGDCLLSEDKEVILLTNSIQSMAGDADEHHAGDEENEEDDISSLDATQDLDQTEEGDDDESKEMTILVNAVSNEESPNLPRGDSHTPFRPSVNSHATRRPPRPFIYSPAPMSPFPSPYMPRHCQHPPPPHLLPYLMRHPYDPYHSMAAPMSPPCDMRMFLYGRQVPEMTRPPRMNGQMMGADAPSTPNHMRSPPNQRIPAHTWQGKRRGQPMAEQFSPNSNTRSARPAQQRRSPPSVLAVPAPSPQSHSLSRKVPYPLIYVSPAGTISIVLRHEVVLELAVDRSVRIVLHDRFAVMSSSRGNSSAILHPLGRILHTKDNVYSRFSSTNEKLAVFGWDGVLFTMSHLSEAYLVNASLPKNNNSRASAVSLDQLRFPAMDHDFTLQLFYSEAQTGEQFIALCKEIVAEATYECLPDGSLFMHINGLSIRQASTGEVYMDARPRYIVCNPHNNSVQVRSTSIDMAIEANEKGYVKRGPKRVHVSRSGMVVSDGNCITSMDHFGRIVCCN